MKKRLWAVAMAVVLSFTGAVPVMAETEAKPRVFVSFVSAGQSVGKFISQGTSTTAPEAVFMPGYTFCGWDKSLNNIELNTQFNAVYLPDYVGEAAIEARKKSLPSPAISKTKVADPVDVNTDNSVCLPQQAAAFTTQAMAQAAGLMTSAVAQAQAAQTLQQAAVAASAAANQYAQAQAALTNIMAGVGLAQNTLNAAGMAQQAANPAMLTGAAPAQTAPAPAQTAPAQAATPAEVLQPAAAGQAPAAATAGTGIVSGGAPVNRS